MNSLVIQGVEPIFQPCYQTTNKFTTTNSVSRVSFTTRTRFTSFYARAQTTDTFYEVLGISESCNTESDIKKAYKQMARKYHPDVSPPDRVDENTKKFIMVHEAYEILSNPHTKACYDRDLIVGSSSAFLGNKKSEEWKSRLDELINGRNINKGKMSWGARIRKKNISK